MSYLLGAKADLNSASSGQLTALSAAINQKQEPVALLLLEHGANPNVVDSVGSTPLIEAAVATNKTDVVQALKAAGATE